jgi:hypothetical protein
MIENRKVSMKNVLILGCLCLLVPSFSYAAPNGVCDDAAIDWAVYQANDPLCTRETAVIESSTQPAFNYFQITIGLCPNQTRRTWVPMKATEGGAGGYTCQYSGE